MVYNAANSQQSNTYQYPTDKKVRKLFEVPTYIQKRKFTIKQSSNFLVFINVVTGAECGVLMSYQ